MPKTFPDIIRLADGATGSFASMDTQQIRGTATQIDDLTSASLATIGSGLSGSFGKRSLGHIVVISGSATKAVKYYAFIQTSSGDINLSGSEWTTLSNWGEIQIGGSSGDTVDLHFSASEGTGFSFANNATASFESGSGGGLTVTAGATNKVTFNLVNVVSSSAQIATDISGAINSATSSILSDYGLLSSSAQIATDISGAINSATSSILNDYGLLSSSAQIATDVSGAINAASSSILNDYGLLSSSAQIATDISGAINSATSSILSDYGLLSSSIQIAGDISGAIDAATGSFLLDTTDTFEGILTLSGNLSVTGDGNITASNGTFEGGIIRANTDSENYIKGALSFKGGATAYRAAAIARGGASLGTVSGDVETADLVISTNNLNNFFIFKGNTTGGGALIISGGNSPASGSPSLDVRGPISASGNISASGDIFANNIRAVGDVIAQRYIVSSSVSHITQSFSSGSTIFGDTSNDTHQFTGSLLITGSSVTSERTPLVITAGGEVQVADADFVTSGDVGAYELDISSSGDNDGITITNAEVLIISGAGGLDVTADTNTLTFTVSNGILSSSAQIADEISGSFNSVSASIASDIITGFSIQGDGGAIQPIANGDTIDIAGGTNVNTQGSATDTITVNLDNNIFLTGQGLFLSGGLHDWGKNNDVDATSGFRLVGDRAYTHVTPQFTRARHALVGSLIRSTPTMNLADFPLNYLVYSKAGVTINGGINDTDPDVTTPVDPKIAGGKDNVGIPVVQIAGDLEIRPTQSMDGGGTTPGIRIAAGDSSGSVDPGIFFYNRDNISNNSSSFFYSSASAEIRFDTASQAVKFFAGSTTENLTEVLHVSRSGNNPRIGIGLSDPIKAFDFKEIRDDNRGGEILIRGSRTTKGAENNDEVGRINFAIDSSSFGKIDTSGSAAEIVAIVDDIDPTGVEGSLSLRVASAKTAGSVQRIKLIGNPNSPAVEFTGSTEFDTDVTIGDDLTVNDFALLNAVRIGSTATDPGDGVLHVEDYGVFVGGLKVGSSEDPGANNLIVDGTTTLKGITNIGNQITDTLVVSASNVDFPSVVEKSTLSTTDNVLVLEGNRVKQTPQTSLPFANILDDGSVPPTLGIAMFTGSSGKTIVEAPGITYNAGSGLNLTSAGSLVDLTAGSAIIGTLLGNVTSSGNISSSGTIIANEYVGLPSGLLSSSADFVTNSQTSSFSTATGVEDNADVTDTANVTAAGALMDSELSEIATVKSLTAAGISGSFNSVSASLASDIPTNNNQLTNGAGYTTNTGTVDTSGTPADNQIAVFTDADTIEGTSKLTFSNSELLVHSTNTDNTGIEIFGGVFGASQPYISPVGANSRMNFGDGTSGHIFDFGNNKISFDSDSTNTYIQADTDFPENLEIHADGNIELRADDNLEIHGPISTNITASGDISASGTITAATLDAAAVSDTLAAAIVAEIDNDEIPIAKLAEDSISGVALGSNLNNLTVDNATLQLNSGTTYNGSAARTISIKDGGVDSDALADDITVAGTLTVAADIQHSGDTDTKIAFSTDVVSIKAGNVSVFESSATGSVLPNVHQNIFDTGSLALNANSAFGDIVKFGGSSTIAGGLYYLKPDGTWGLAQANAAATSTGSLAVAVGTNSTTDGMCIRGFINPGTDPGAGIGSPVYVSDTNPGRILATAPSSTGDVVRIIGHQYGTDLIYFNPSNDFIVHA